MDDGLTGRSVRQSTSLAIEAVETIRINLMLIVWEEGAFAATEWTSYGKGAPNM